MPYHLMQGDLLQGRNNSLVMLRALVLLLLLGFVNEEEGKRKSVREGKHKNARSKQQVERERDERKERLT